MKSDPMWDAMVKACRWPTQITDTQRGQLNTALKQLRDIQATAGQIRARGLAYERRWPDMTVTPMALVKHWGEFAPAEDKQKPTDEAPHRWAGYDKHGNAVPDVGLDDFVGDWRGRFCVTHRRWENEDGVPSEKASWFDTGHRWDT